jgi:hypothetical protein
MIEDKKERVVGASGFEPPTSRIPTRGQNARFGALARDGIRDFSVHTVFRYLFTQAPFGIAPNV